MESGAPLVRRWDGLRRCEPDTLIVVQENSSMWDSNVTNVSVRVSSGQVDLSTTKVSGGILRSCLRTPWPRWARIAGRTSRVTRSRSVSQLTLMKGNSEVLRGTERVTLGAYERVSFRGEAGSMSRQRVMGPPLLLIPANQAPVVATEGQSSRVTFSWTPVPSAKGLPAPHLDLPDLHQPGV